jgi:glucose/arabinose dehydrogenase
MSRTRAVGAALIVLAACSSAGVDPEVVAAPTSSTAPLASTSSPALVAATSSPAPNVTTTTADATTTTAAAPTTVVPVAVPDLDGLSVRLTTVADLDEPVAMAIRPGAPADEQPYVLERAGVIRRLGDDGIMLDVRELTTPGGEQGVLGLAFSPDAGHLYVNYTDPAGDTHIDEFAADDSGALDADSRRPVLAVDQPYGNHNGGHLAFGPDGMLYIGLGDGGSANDPERRGLDVGSLLGKMLRIDPREAADGSPYSIPADNPYVGVDGARGEIWSVGLRNPWRYSFDRLTGDLWIGDVGQGQWEEIDVALAATGGGRGVNYGWSAFEGTHRFNDDQPAEGHTPPVWEYEHGDDGSSVTGGFVYRGEAIPRLVGAYVFADYTSGKIWAAAPGPNGEVAEVRQIAKLVDLASFGENAQGELFALALGGTVARLDPA